MSPAPGGRALRAARSGAAVVAAVLVALTAHLAGGGAAPSPLLVLAVAAIAWPAALLLVGGRPRLWRRAAVIGVAQAMLHGVFALGAPAAAAAGVDPMAGMHGVPLPPLAAASMDHGSGMWWAHVAAWAITVAAWHRGEAALQGLLTRVPWRALLLLLVPVALPAGPAAPIVRRRSSAPAAVLLAAHRDRGPPLPA